MQHGTIIRTHTGRPIADLSTGELQLKRLVDHIPTAVFFLHGFVESFKHSRLKMQKRFIVNGTHVNLHLAVCSNRVNGCATLDCADCESGFRILWNFEVGNFCPCTANSMDG